MGEVKEEKEVKKIGFLRYFLNKLMTKHLDEMDEGMVG